MQFIPEPSRHQRVRKVPPGQPRARPINSCLNCRDRKKGCDRGQPVCGHCVKNPDPNKPCVYYASGKAEVLKVHKRKMQSLKEDFAFSVAKDTFHEGGQIKEYHPLRPLAVTQNACGEDADDESAYLGIRLGKLRISDRVEGLFRPKIVEELTYALDISAHLYPVGTQRSHHYSLSSNVAQPRLSTMILSNNHPWDSADAFDDFPYLLERSIAENVLAHYWECVHPVARVLHRPSFTRMWMNFWESHELGKKISRSSSALVFTTLFAGLVGTPEKVIRSKMKKEKRNLVHQMRVGVENALARSNWIHSAKIEALQAVVIYLIISCCDEVSNAHSNIVAAAIRAAEGIELHEDGSNNGYSAVQIHIRRLVWYQLLVLDITTCNATGPRPLKRKGDFSTRMPLNVDEHLIDNETVDSPGWTDMTTTIIRFKCNEFIREIWNDRLRLKDEQVSVGEILIKIKSFEAHVQGAYGRMAKLDVPIQKYGFLLAKVLSSAPYAMVLHQYSFHQEIKMSDNVKKIFIKYGIQIMEAVKELGTAQDLNRWRWFSGGVQQHHYAFAMLLELLKNPFLSQAVPILKGLDYVFEPPVEFESMPLTRIRFTVTELRNRLKSHIARRQLQTFKDVCAVQDVPDLERFDSSTCSSSTRNSVTPRDVSPIPHITGFPDVEQACIALPKSSKVSTEQSKVSGPNPVSNSLRPVKRAYWLPRIDQRQSIDIDTSSLAQYFPDIMETNLTMSVEDSHSIYHSDPGILQHDELSVIQPTNDIHADHNPISDFNPNIHIEAHTDESLKESENLYANFYDIDDFTGYCTNSSVLTEPLANIYAAPQPNDLPAEVSDSFQSVPNEETCYGGRSIYDQQQMDQYPTFILNSRSTQGVVYSNGSESNPQISPHAQVAHQKYSQQYIEGLEYSTPVNHALNVQYQ